MTKAIFLMLFVLFIVSQTCKAQDEQRSLEKKNMGGIRISSQDAVVNNSITYKRFFNPTLALEGLFTFGEPAALGFLVEKHTPFGPSGLSWFWGAGAYAGFGSTHRFGLQGAAGLDLIFPGLPVNMSLDWKPELNLTKQFSFEPAAIGLSARFVF